jgi:hypothetical protein
VTAEYLDQQAAKQVASRDSGILGSHSSVAQRREDRVFRLLQNERNLCKALPLRNANRIGRPGSQERRAAVAAVAERELTFEELLETREGATAVARTDTLLEEVRSAHEEWQPHSAVYQRSQRCVSLAPRSDPEGPVQLRPLSHRQLREVGIALQ